MPVSIAAFQAVDPGSLPGRRISLFFFFYLYIFLFFLSLGPLSPFVRIVFMSKLINLVSI